MSQDAPTIDLPTPSTQKQKRANRLVQRAYGVPDAPPEDFNLDTNGADPPVVPDMLSMKLLRNYRPRGQHEVLGYWQDEKTRKDSIGQVHVIQKHEFIPGVTKPPEVAGTGYTNKHFAGTVIKVPKDEARFLKDEGIAEREID